MGPMVQRRCPCGVVFPCRDRDGRMICRKCFDRTGLTLGEAIARRAHELDYTSVTIARQGKVNIGTVKGCLGNHAGTNVKSLVKIAHALGCCVMIVTDQGQTIYSSKESHGD